MYRLMFLLLFFISLSGMHLEIEKLPSLDGMLHRKYTSGNTTTELFLIGENDLIRRTTKDSNKFEYFGQLENQEKKEIEQMDDAAAELLFYSLLEKCRRIQ
jgi:hypothetical protein